MSWVITGAQPFPAVIGEPFGGGYFAGYISHTADGNPTHALIVAPRGGVEPGATGLGYTSLTTSLQWKTTNTQTLDLTNPTILFDGVANTAAIAAAGINDHPAAKFCTELTIGGFTDWYLPSLYELEIAYFNLKPTVAQNSTSYGSNPYSVPPRSTVYTVSYPAVTNVTAFNTSAEAFADNAHWSSSESFAVSTWPLVFSNGSQPNNQKTTAFRVRAFRRIAL